LGAAKAQVEKDANRATTATSFNACRIAATPRQGFLLFSTLRQFADAIQNYE
jgi:hypothetical protein